MVAHETAGLGVKFIYIIQQVMFNMKSEVRQNQKAGPLRDWHLSP